MAKNETLLNSLKAFLVEQEARKKRGEEFVTQSAMGRAMTYTNGSIISQYLSNEPFKGNLPLFENRLAAYLGFESKVEEFADKPNNLKLINEKAYVPTSISEGIYAAIEYCRLATGISILHGDAGVGKTMAAKKYVRENKGAAIYIRAKEGCIRRREVIMELTEKLGIKDAKNPAERYSQIRKKLHKARKVIIFDEAHRLPLQTLEFIRDLAEEEDDENENVRDGAGVVLIGNTKVSKWIKNVKREDMEQFRNRTIWEGHYLRKDTTLEDVKLVFTHLVEQNMERELEALWRISALQIWGLRGAVKIYNNAVNGGDVSYEGLLKTCAASKIGIM